MWKRSVLIGAALALLLPVALAGVWVYGLATGPAVVQAATPTYDPARTITVVGQGSVKVEPDMAQISIGVETSADSVAEATTENEAQMKAILAALKAAGIADKDIQTMNYSIQINRYPEPLPREGGEVKPEYMVSNMVQVTIRDLEAVSAVLDAVIEAGANNIWGVSFGLSDPAAAQADARARAVADAQKRTQALAELGKVKLGPVMSMSETLGGGLAPYAVVVERAAAGGPVSPGELEVGFQVQVTYFIEP